MSPSRDNPRSVEPAALLPGQVCAFVLTTAVSDLDPIFQDGILRNRMGAAAARSGAPCVPLATLGPWDIPPANADAWFIHYLIYN